MELKGKKINFLGDSITQGVGASCNEHRYSSVVAARTGAIERNYGISGTRIARQQIPSDDPNRDKNFCMRVAEMDKDADIVVVFGGTNDFGHGDAKLGVFVDRTSDTFYGALHTLYISLIEKFPESQIVILTPFHRLCEDNPCGTHGGSVEYGVLKEYVNAIREVAEYYSLPILDLYATSGIQPNVDIIREKYMPDGLHPNDAGHEKLAGQVIAFLKSL